VLEPEYGEHVIPVLDRIEHDPTRQALWNAICDACRRFLKTDPLRVSEN